MAIVDSCPAFLEGCPFSKLDADLLPTIMELVPGDIQEKCPSFKDGCPFKDTDSVETLYIKLSDMPLSHQPNQDNSAAKAVEETLRLVHTKSVQLKAKFNTTCPVFSTSCPFKTLTTYGSPLVAELDDIVERWGLAEAFVTDGKTQTQGEDTLIESSEANVDVPAEEPLSKSLKAGTKIVHRSAENVHFVKDFLKGSVPRSSYIELLRALYHVYNALEIALRSMPEHLKHCDFRVLERAQTLEADLRYYLDTPEDDAVSFGLPSPAAQQYIHQVERLAKEDPLMLLAHAYTRYLGDLSGGQILARSAQKAYRLPEGKGTSFYRFDGVGSTAADLKAFKKVYRSSLDAFQLSARRADALVQEANKAFLMNILLFEERDVAAGYLERIRTLQEITELIEANVTPLEFQRAYGTKSSEIVSQCPFIPGPAGQRKAGDPSFHGDSAVVCPWPFLWFHDPKGAMLTHPVKNMFGFATSLGLLRVAWSYPRRSAVAFVIAALGLASLKPKKRSKDGRETNDAKH